VLAYGFSENYKFTEKTDRNSVFIGREPHILDRLHIMVTYISFYGFLKKIKISLKMHMC
jgi:hypothetical protein